MGARAWPSVTRTPNVAVSVTIVLYCHHVATSGTTAHSCFKGQETGPTRVKERMGAGSSAQQILIEFSS